MKKLLPILIVTVFILPASKKMLGQTNSFPSTGAAGIGTLTPDASSLLEIKSTTQGLLISRMTITQRNAIVSPATGLMIYQTNSTPGFYYYDGAAWKAVTQKSKGWSLTGNSGIDTAINFIGTIDAMPLILKVNNQRAGYLDYAGTANTSFGYQCLLNNTTGTYNTANGFNALFKNTTGYYNIANGAYALTNNTTGLSNVANGAYALYFNLSGGSNVASGSFALYSNTAGASNIASGFDALYNNSTGSNNIASGYRSLYSNTKGSSNVAEGHQALYSNTTGYSNVAIGVKALYSNTDRSNLVAIGDSALYKNGIGAVNSYDATGNTAIGSKALYSNTTGDQNTANGWMALYSNTTGFNNTANGYQSLYSNTTGDGNTANGGMALYSNTTGYGNTANGYQSLSSNTTGKHNIALGIYADVSTGNLANATAIGYFAKVDASNKVRVGNTSVTSIGGQVGWTTFSDGRYKKNIKENVKGLSFINSLRPITYIVDVNSLNEYYNKGRQHDDAYEKMTADMQPSANEAAKIVYNGFIAQDVEAAAKKINYDFSGVDKPKTEDGIYGLRYGDFVVPLVKAVQELSKMNDAKDEKINDLQKQINELKQMMISNAPNNISLSDASLEQNIPNPFRGNTSIGYNLPQKLTSAKIIITDKNGKTLKTENLSGTGRGRLNVDASILANGAYNYSLYVDGKLIATKQMVLTK